jgi:phosphatidylserine/phosphatidylglycerophosphate/cardiolipin synthase-like enzyme
MLNLISFEFEDFYEVIVGSSNITASAFKTNIEWNVKTTLKKEDEFFKNILNEFNNLWKESFEVNEEFLRNYEFFVNLQKEQTFVYSQKIKTNFMQKNALEKLEILRQKKTNKSSNNCSNGKWKNISECF